MTREPDRYDKLAETLFSGAMYPSPGQVAAALRQAALDALERLAEELAINKNGNIQAGPARRTHVGLIHGIEIAEAVVHRHVLAASRALASPAAAPAWTPPRDAMTGMTADEEMRAAGIDVLRGARPAAAPAASQPSEPAAPAHDLRDVEHIDNLLAEFADDPNAALACISEYVGLRLHNRKPPGAGEGT